MQALWMALSVGVGGGIGALLRHFMAGGIIHRFGNDFPYAILSINVLGSLLMGVLVQVLTHAAPGNQVLRSFLAVGVLGGFTTFSSFSLDTLVLAERGEYGSAALYVFLSVALSLAAIFIGMFATRSLLA
jgi:fluoride exporter